MARVRQVEIKNFRGIASLLWDPYPERYRQRNLIERFFNKLKHLRRIATRYDKLARNVRAL